MAVRCKLGGVLAAIRSQRAPPFQPKFLSKPTLFIQNQVHFCTRMEFWRGTGNDTEERGQRTGLATNPRSEKLRNRMDLAAQVPPGDGSTGPGTAEWESRGR